MKNFQKANIRKKKKFKKTRHEFSASMSSSGGLAPSIRPLNQTLNRLFEDVCVSVTVLLQGHHRVLGVTVGSTATSNGCLEGQQHFRISTN